MVAGATTRRPKAGGGLREGSERIGNLAETRRGVRDSGPLKHGSGGDLFGLDMPEFREPIEVAFAA
jgi:hypothetical protein